MAKNAKRKFWSFKALGNREGELCIYGEIADSQGGWFDDSGAVTPTSFKEELDALGDLDTLHVYMNSPGGDVFAGQAIHSQLKRNPANVMMHIDGLAASIASVIAMAGDTIYMPSNAMMMIHHPMTGVYGNANQMRETADTLDKVSDSIQQTYLTKAGEMMTPEMLKEVMDNETWMTAQDAYGVGLCDVIEDEMALTASANDLEILAKYRNTPRFIRIKDENTVEEAESAPEVSEKVQNEPENEPSNGPCEAENQDEIEIAKAILALELAL